MEQCNPSTTANRAPLRGAPREAHQRTGDEGHGERNKKALDFLKRQAESNEESTFQAARFFGACEALCMAGVITAEQWQEIDDAREVFLNPSKKGKAK